METNNKKEILSLIIKEKGRKRDIEITNKPIKEVDSVTGNKLNRIYLRISIRPSIRSTEETYHYFFNEDSTPDCLRCYWDTFNEKRNLAIQRIKIKMNMYFINKSEI